MKRPSTMTLLALAIAGSALFGLHGVSAQTAPAAAPAAAPAGDAARGKVDFMGYGCYECHGTLGQGNFTTAPRLAPHPLPYGALSAYVRRPSGNNMPSFSEKILPDKNLADIYAYLSSIPAGKTGEQIPLLSGTNMKSK